MATLASLERIAPTISVPALAHIDTMEQPLTQEAWAPIARVQLSGHCRANLMRAGGRGAYVEDLNQSNEATSGQLTRWLRRAAAAPAVAMTTVSQQRLFGCLIGARLAEAAISFGPILIWNVNTGEQAGRLAGGGGAQLNSVPVAGGVVDGHLLLAVLIRVVVSCVVAMVAVSPLVVSELPPALRTLNAASWGAGASVWLLAALLRQQLLQGRSLVVVRNARASSSDSHAPAARCSLAAARRARRPSLGAH